MGRVLLWTISLCLTLCYCQGQDSTKAASVVAVRDEATNVVAVTLRVALNDDADGRLIGLDFDEYSRNPKNYSKSLDPCDITLVDKVYRVTTYIDESTVGNGAISNRCGMVVSDPLGGPLSYTWHFLHQIDSSFIMQQARVFIFTINPSDINSNELTVPLTVLNPDLIKSVTPQDLDTDFSIWLKDPTTDQYTRIQPNDNVDAGSVVRLQLDYVRSALHDAQTSVAALNSFSTEYGRTAAFQENDMLINSNGCFITTGNRYPGTPHGFRGSLLGNTWRLVSGDFNIHQYTNNVVSPPSTEVYFRTYFDICYESGINPITKCENLCNFNTGSEPNRKKRQTGDKGVVVISVNVVNDKQGSKTSDDSLKTTTTIIVGSTVGVVVLLLIVVAIVVIVTMSRRQRKMRKMDDNIRDVYPNPTIIPTNKC